MAQEVGHLPGRECFDGAVGLFHPVYQLRGEVVPLRYNKDKSKNPVISRVFRFVLILFPVKKGQKTALKRGVENGGVT